MITVTYVQLGGMLVASFICGGAMGLVTLALVMAFSDRENR